MRLLTAPLDLIKIRLQLSPTAASTFSTFRGVLKNEGPFAFFKGNIAATYLWVTYAAVQFGVYRGMQGWLEDCNTGKGGGTNKACVHGIVFATVCCSFHLNPNPPTTAENYFPYRPLPPSTIAFLAGASAGLTATLATYPFDYIRTAFASNKQGGAQSIFSFMAGTYKRRGVGGFYAGVLPACYRYDQWRRMKWRRAKRRAKRVGGGRGGGLRVK